MGYSVQEGGSLLKPLVELLRLVDGRYLQDLDQPVLLANLIKDGERSADMQSIELVVQMQKLLIGSQARVGVLGESAALLLDEPLALLRKLR
ncbi:MAG: hypothetical protein METHAR1v1_1840006 [Methanothrix sp.]|nr:MAG: hypothetical protein METHAR1v1_1840006 [Methanothrix sp.]